MVVATASSGDAASCHRAPMPGMRDALIHRLEASPDAARFMSELDLRGALEATSDDPAVHRQAHERLELLVRLVVWVGAERVLPGSDQSRGE